MTPRELEYRWAAHFLDPVPLEEDWTQFAVELLVAGFDTPSLNQLAGVPSGDSDEAESLVTAALVELGLVGVEDVLSAAVFVGHRLADDLLTGARPIEAVAREARSYWDFDEVWTYGPSYPDPINNFADMAFRISFDQEQYYVPAGGDDEFRRRAQRLLDWQPAPGEPYDRPGESLRTTPAQIAVWYVLRVQYNESLDDDARLLPHQAAELLAYGYSSPSLTALANYGDADGAGARRLLRVALRELGSPVDTVVDEASALVWIEQMWVGLRAQPSESSDSGPAG